MKKRVLNMVAGVLLLGVALVGNALALDPPVLIDGVTASPSEIIPGEIISLTVAAPGYSDESLTYAWELERAPIEAVAVQIQEPNAKSTAVSGFTSTGSYTFEVTVTDDRGVSGREQVIVTVRDMSQPVVEITSPEEGDGIPADAEVTVSVYDDLDHTVIYDVKLDVYSGGSVLASSHSLSSGPYSFDLGADLTDEHGSQIVLSPGTYTVKAIATSEGMYGDDDVMVVVSDDYLRAPDITVLPSAVPSTMLVDETTTLNVVATHAEGAPIYTWSKADGPGEVTFSTNGTEQSGTTEATFSQVGEYVLDVVASYGTATNTRQLTVKVYDFVLDLRGTVVGPSSEISVDIIWPDDIN